MVTHRARFLWPLIKIGSLLTIVLPSLGDSQTAFLKNCQSKEASAPYAITKLAQLLNWQTDPNHPCGGSFPSLPKSHHQTLKQPTTLYADHVSLSPSGTSTLAGHVQVTQNNRILRAQRAQLIRDAKDEPKQLQLKGNLSIAEHQRMLVGQCGQLDIQTKTQDITNAGFRIHSLNPVSGELTHAWGQAKSIHRSPDNQLTIVDGQYSTCPPGAYAWHLRAKRLQLNPHTGMATTHHPKFYLGDVPVLYFPWLQFPIDDRRHTGFLTPSFTHSSFSGFDVELPFYWNIRPNLDTTLTPRYLTKRGVMLKTHTRYLLPKLHGELMFDYLPHDSAFKKLKARPSVTSPHGNQRIHLSTQHHIQFNKHFTAQLKYNAISDDHYFRDLMYQYDNLSINQLEQSAQLNWMAYRASASLLFQRFQVIRPPFQATSEKRFSQLPKLTTHVSRTRWGWDLAMDAQWTHFLWPGRRNDNRAPWSRVHRLIWHPTLSKTFHRGDYRFTPSVGVHLSHYQLSKLSQSALAQHLNVPITNAYVQAVAARKGDSQSRVIPQLALLQSYHHLISAGEPEQQYHFTPKLMYLYVPYHRQEKFPLLDSSLIIPSYETAFIHNRFSGEDRIGDTHQLTGGLEWRWEVKGRTRLTMGLAQTIHLANRGVAIFARERDNQGLIGYHATQGAMGPSMGLLAFELAPLSLSYSTTFDGQRRRAIQHHLTSTWSFTPQRHIHLSYRYLANGDQLIRDTLPATGFGPLHLLGGGAYWSINDRVKAIGLVQYDFGRKYFRHFNAGIEYNSCCWAVRFFAGRSASRFTPGARPEYNNAFSIQVLFKGIGQISNNPISEYLETQLPGFKDPFAQPVLKGLES